MSTQPEPSRKWDRTTQQQIQHYIEFCKNHPEIIRYQLERHGKVAPIHVQQLWAQLVDQLNEIRGPTRTIKKWKDSLTHWRNQLRSRSRKYKAQNGRDGSYSHYENKLKFVDLPAPENDEGCAKVHQSAEVNENIEFPFDSIYLPCPSEGNSTSSRSPTPDSDISDVVTPPPAKKCKPNKSVKSQTSNFAGICASLLKNLDARREREELQFMQQQTIMSKLDQTLTTMNNVLEKINNKLDRM